jgi:cobalt-zinc-cadmium efflux system outer membrane protein
MVQGRTVAPEVYTPEQDALVADKVEALLADGLTVDEAVSLALLNNRDLQAAFYDIGVSRADVVQSQLLTNPDFSIVPKYPDAGGLAQLNISFAQELVDLWQIPIRKKVAEAQLEATILDIARQCVELAANVRSAAYELLTLRQTEKTVLENLELAERSEDLARTRFGAGEASALDVNLARSNTMDVRLELLQIQRQTRLAQAALAQQLNLVAPAGAFELADTLPEPIPLPDEPALLALALDQRFDARAAEHRLQAAENAITREWLGLFPSVTAGFELERPERRALPGRDILADTARESIAAGQLTAPSIESRAQRQRERRQEIDNLLGPSFGMTLPIWNQNQAQIAAAVYRAEQQRKQLESLANQIATQVTRASISLQNTGEIVAFYRDQALPQANLSLDNARQLYEAGESDILATIEAQQSLLAKRRAYVTALGEYAAALAEMERAIGGRLPADVAAEDVAAEPAVAPAATSRPSPEE